MVDTSQLWSDRKLNSQREEQQLERSESCHYLLFVNVIISGIDLAK